MTGVVIGGGDTMDKLTQIETAIKNPETIAETEREILDRDRAYDLWLNSGGRKSVVISEYEAGWKAAKAYYENHR